MVNHFTIGKNSIDNYRCSIGLVGNGDGFHVVINRHINKPVVWIETVVVNRCVGQRMTRGIAVCRHSNVKHISH